MKKFVVNNFKWWKSSRGRILFVVFVFFTLIICGIIIDRWNINKIAHNVAFLEKNDEFLNDILEIRRYEKNFLLYKEQTSYKNTLEYVEKAENLLNQNKTQFQTFIGLSTYQKLQNLIENYKELFINLNPYNNGKKEEKLREIGKKLVDIAIFLDNKVKHNISRAFTLSRHIALYFGFVSVSMGCLLIYIAIYQIVRPLNFVQQSADRISKGDFSSFPRPKEVPLEIRTLIDALNKMIQELDLKHQQIIQAKKMASIGTLTAGIAHELNNPINNIVITAQLFLEEFEKDLSPEQKEYLIDILQQAQRCTDIVENLLDFSRAKPLAKKQVSIQKIISDVLKLFQNQMKLNNIELEVDMNEDLPLIKGDPTSLRQIFVNLIENAIQAMPKGGSLFIGVEKDNNFIKIEIADTGKGIPKEYLSRIFEPFFTTKKEGTGLGLAVTYGIIRKHKGRIFVESKVNEGTTFTILLPIRA
ncbi:MAG TPA: HAMP domain-containing protein [Candidatus Desulfofervidus auxilii]|uniref:histidine kinase n=1 Tax=Desulfofervidus auxilii TaxID=1621989 RepID=A0A7C0Y2C0_DESA2|nr:HAMP domain-containing protein [Candidatus Desulfofervidus auxilii]